MRDHSAHVRAEHRVSGRVDGGVAVDPITHIDPITHQLHLSGWLYDPGKTSAGHFQQTDAKTGVLYPYLNSLDMYRCTIDDGNWGPNTVQVISSYIMNGAVCGFGAYSRPKYRISQFNPAAYVVTGYRHAVMPRWQLWHARG